MRFNSATGKTALDATSILLAAAGVFLWFREPQIPRVTLAGVAVDHTPSTLSPSSPGANVDGGTIVTSNIFAANRTAPAVRYSLPGSGSAADVSSSAMRDDLPATPALLPTVYGTMTGPNGATALIQSDSAGASGRLYREGDRVGIFRIEKILASSVVVRGPAGRVELKVEQRGVARE